MAKKMGARTFHIPAIKLWDLAYPEHTRFEEPVLPANKKYTMIARYIKDTDTIERFEFDTGNQGMRLAGILNEAGKFIERIYCSATESNLCRDCGNGMDDMLLRRIRVNHKKRTVELGVDY